jgi:hypothetical protein
MPFLKKLFDFYIFSNIHVALAGFCITKITLLNYGFTSNTSALFVAFSIVLSYNFIRFYEIKNNQQSWFQNWFLLHQKELIIVSLLSFIGIVYLLVFEDFNFKSLWLLFPFAFMTFFYVIPLLKFRNYKVSFRDFPGIKIFSIAIAWAGISVLFPLKEVGFAFNSTVLIEFFQRIFILIAITLPFDIRDVNYDSKLLKTLPQVLGIKASIWLGELLLFLFVILAFFIKDSLLISISIASITGFFLWFSSSKTSIYYTSFWVEAIPIFWLILIIIFL